MFASKGQRRDCVFLFVYMYMYVCVYICAVCVGIKGVAVERGGKRGKKKNTDEGGLDISVSQAERFAVPECVQAARCRTETTGVPKIN